jgi:hypothetical protein
MIKFQFLFLLLFITLVVFGQNVGVNNINHNVGLDIKGGLATRAFTAIGVSSISPSFYSFNSGNYNTAVGMSSLKNNRTDNGSVAIAYQK